MTAGQQMLVGGSGVTLKAIAGNATGRAGSGTNANATLTINTDGTWQLTAGPVVVVVNPSGLQNYVGAPFAGVGAVVWVRAVPTVGTVSSGTMNTWLQLNVARTWVKASTVADDDAGFTVQLSLDAGATIGASGAVSIGYTHV